MRLLLYPSRAYQFYKLRFFDDFLGNAKERDAYFFINHRHYLTRFFRLRERIDNALFHYRHELHTFDEAYRALVYGSNGLVLWAEQVHDVKFRICLVATDDNRTQGDVSVILWVNEQLLCRMAYTIVDSATLGMLSGPMLFVTRNQVKQSAGLDRFRACFPQNAPSYFCLAAIAGIALANDLRSIAVIKAEAQIAYDPRNDTGFKNAYCNFWGNFGAREIGRQAYLISAPPELPPLSDVKSKHRSRAINRRTHWAAIIVRAQSTLSAHRLGSKEKWPRNSERRDK
jgi:uncharacterized protein VirK/YbjX